MKVWWQNRQTFSFAFRTLTTEYRVNDQYGLISNLKQVRQKGHTVDALASRAEEGRGMTAKSIG